MKSRNFIFATLLLFPAVVVLILNLVEKTDTAETLAIANDIIGITLPPFIGGLLLNSKKSYLLATSIPILLILSKSLFFTGAERIVVVGFVVFLGISLVSCTLSVAGRRIYQTIKMKNH